MSFTLREDIPSLHSVIRCPDYEPSSYCTAPIGVTYINQGADGVTHYRHFLQPAGNHDFLFVQAARYYSRLLGRQLSSDDEKIIRHGASPELNHLTCLTDLIITGYFYQPDNTPVVYCSYREIAECPDAPHDPETSRYIAELGAYGLYGAPWIALHEKLYSQARRCLCLSKRRSCRKRLLRLSDTNECDILSPRGGLANQTLFL